MCDFPAICAVCKQQRALEDYRYHYRLGFRAECRFCEYTIQRCTRCNQVKRHNCFWPAPYGLKIRSICKDCTRQGLIRKPVTLLFKCCSGCHFTKSASEFSYCITKADRLHNKCKKCMARYTKLYKIKLELKLRDQ